MRVNKHNYEFGKLLFGAMIDSVFQRRDTFGYAVVFVDFFSKQHDQMTKSDLIERLTAHHPKLAERDVYLSVNFLLEKMAMSLANGRRVDVRGFGNFDIYFRPPRTGRNPKTGAKVLVPAKYVPHFKAGKELRDRVNEKKFSR